MPAYEPTDEKLRRNKDKATGLGTKVALFVVRPPESATTSEADSFDEVVHSPAGPC